MASLLVDVLLHYRKQDHYFLHEFVVMPDHFHLLITPTPEVTLERAMQLIKGGFSYRAKNELGKRFSIWQTSFHDRRVRDWEEYQGFRTYIYANPVKRGLCAAPELYRYSSVTMQLDDVPQRLKPTPMKASNSQA